MRHILLIGGAALVLIAALSGCAKKEDVSQTSSDSLLASNPVEQPQGNLTPQTEYQQKPEAETPPATQPVERPAATHAARPHSRSASTTTRSTTEQAPEHAVDRGVTLEAGTPIQVTVQSQISTDTAKQGDTWTGEVKDPVIVGDRVVLPAGSTVTGVVTAVTPAQKGTRAALDLEVRSVTVNGKSHEVSAGTESIVAGSPRARNMGAVVGGAAAGALIGRAVGGSGKGALIGGLLGGAAASGAVAGSKGFQVTIKEGTVITFSVHQNVQVRS